METIQTRYLGTVSGRDGLTLAVQKFNELMSIPVDRPGTATGRGRAIMESVVAYLVHGVGNGVLGRWATLTTHYTNFGHSTQPRCADAGGYLYYREDFQTDIPQSDWTDAERYIDEAESAIADFRSR